MFDAVTCAIPGAKTPQPGAGQRRRGRRCRPLPPETMAAVRAVYDERIRALVHPRW